MKNIILTAFLLLSAITINATNNVETFTSEIKITVKGNSLSFYIPTENKEVYVLIADDTKKVFQKIKVHQRGNGTISFNQSGLPKGIYYYTLLVDGELSDSQKVEVK